MKCPGKIRRRPSAERQVDAGYMLLTLMLMAALVVIALAAVTPKLAQQIRRDQEEELIHRGVQYSRAIRKFYKKFGRYPMRLEELENTNNIRFLRKRYKDPITGNKDPITGNDFKLLHFGEVQMVLAPGIAGAVSPGAQSGILRGAVTPGPTPPANQDLSNPTTDQTQNSSSSQNQNSSSPSSSSSTPSGSASSNSSPGAPVPASAAAGSALVFGGNPILGVASASKKQSIREFNKKNHYDQWQFIYDVSSDRGGLLNGPVQPTLQGPGLGQTQPGQPTGQQTNPSGVPSLGGSLGQGGNPQAPLEPQMPPDQPPQ